MTETTGPQTGPDVPTDLRERLEAAARAGRVLFATDFDGVLAPLGDDPMAVRPVDGAMELLRTATELDGVTVAVVSGRDLQTLATLTSAGGDDDPIVLLGSHGGQGSRPDLLEHPPLTDAQTRALSDLDARLVELVEAHPGARIERKPAAVVLHTRGMATEAGAAAGAAALSIGTAVDGTHPLQGKDVVELAVTDVSKGTALAAVGAALSVDVTCYFGDDVTDETVFTILDPASGDVTVKVGAGDSAAVCRLPDERSVVEAFRVFVEARTGSSPDTR